MFVNNWSFKRYIQINPHNNYLTNNLPHLFFKPVNFLHESENLLGIHKSLTFTFPSILNPNLNLDSILIRQPKCGRWWRRKAQWYFKSRVSFARSSDIDDEVVRKPYNLFFLYAPSWFCIRFASSLSLLQWQFLRLSRGHQGRWRVRRQEHLHKVKSRSRSDSMASTTER